METMGNWQIIATDSITKIKLKRLHESAKILQKGTLIYYCTGCFESFPTELEKSTHYKTHI